MGDAAIHDYEASDSFRKGCRQSSPARNDRKTMTHHVANSLTGYIQEASEMLDEVIITENYNSGYAYSVTGSNIKIKDGTVISPEATYTTSQNTGNDLL